MNCPFCDKSRDVVLQTKDWKVIKDNYPVSKGHMLIVPKYHTTNIDDLKHYNIREFYLLIIETKDILDVMYNPDGYNMGLNLREAAGQTVEHLHFHIIPRYNGDVEKPEGGIRGVIPKKQRYGD